MRRSVDPGAGISRKRDEQPFGGIQMTTARDLMNPGAQCVAAHETLDRAAQLMQELGVGALPICGPDDRLQGIITDRDIVLKCVAAGKDPAKVTAGDLAEGLVWIDGDATVEAAL